MNTATLKRNIEQTIMDILAANSHRPECRLPLFMRVQADGRWWPDVSTTVLNSLNFSRTPYEKITEYQFIPVGISGQVPGARYSVWKDDMGREGICIFVEAISPTELLLHDT